MSLPKLIGKILAIPATVSKYKWSWFQKFPHREFYKGVFELPDMKLLRKQSVKYYLVSVPYALSLALVYSLTFRNSKQTAKQFLFAAHHKDSFLKPLDDLIEIPNFKVSVVVPCYNHEPFLKERLETIYHQTYKNFEVILLDDCSKDKSRDILLEYKNKYPNITKVIFNEKNSGSPYKQWEKGINNADGDLIWIAESDDFSDLHFLEEHVKSFADESVMLSFSPSQFVKNGEVVDSSVKNLADCINPEIWEKSFKVPAPVFVENLLGLKNVIINVSACLFRNFNSSTLKASKWTEYRLCGDWIFYLNLISGGFVVYRANPANFYRIHDASTSLNVQKQLLYYSEHQEVAREILKIYDCSEKTIRRHWHILAERYKREGHSEPFTKFYDVEKVLKNKGTRKPNILIATFGFIPGGGETFPINLANGLKEIGYTVTFYDFNPQLCNTLIKERLSPNIPIINHSIFDQYIIKDLNIDLVHSHHASVDEYLAMLKSSANCDFKHIVTLHGMYEMLEPEIFDNTMKYCKNVDFWVYIADKNLIPFKNNNFYNPKVFRKIYNSVLINREICSRSELGLKPEDFVVTVASRGIREKGWREAVNAVINLNKKLKNIHLIIVGDGDEYNYLKNRKLPKNIHLLGFQKNPSKFIAISDLCLVPSFFKGESVPLIILESFEVGVPVLATNLGEVPKMIYDAESGRSAGWLIDLKEGCLNLNSLTKKLEEIITHPDKLKEYRNNVAFFKDKFSLEKMLNNYLEVYDEVLKKQKMNSQNESNVK